MKRYHVIALALLLVLSGCAAQVLSDPTNPAYSSLDIGHAYQVQSDLILLVVLLAPAVLASFVAFVAGGRRR